MAPFSPHTHTSIPTSKFYLIGIYCKLENLLLVALKYVSVPKKNMHKLKYFILSCYFMCTKKFLLDSVTFMIIFNI